MATDNYGLDYVPKSNRSPIGLVIVGILVVAVIAAFVLSVIVLVRVNDTSATSGPTTTAPGPTTATTPGQNQINVPTQPSISSNSPQYDAYMDAVNQLKMAINTSADPCNNFWEYACGSYPTNMQFSFAIVDVNNYVIQANQMMNSQYQSPNTPQPLQQTIWFFNTCVAARDSFSTITQGGTIVINALKAFQTATSLPFPMLNQNTQQTNWPTSTTLGIALGYLSGVAGVDTFISSFIDTNWQAPQQSATPYYLYIDQSTLSFAKTFYKPGTWEHFQDNFIKEVKSTMMELANLTGVTLDAATLDNDAMDIVNLELVLARNFSTDDTTRRQYARSYNPTSVTQAQTTYRFIDWTAYFKQLSTRANGTVQEIVNSPTFIFSVMETSMISMLSQSLVANNPYGLTPRQVVNYLAYRLVSSKAEFLPKASTYLNQKKLYRPPIGKAHFIRTPEPIDPDQFENKDLTKSQLTCVAETLDSLTYTNARFFIDALYPDKGTSIRQSAGPVIASILSGFQSMIDQLSWMNSTSKVSAYGKITNITQNIAFPDFILDNAKLTDYFSSLTINQADDYITMLDKISYFNAFTQWNYLLQTGNADRTDFLGPPGTANAWYQPELNSITFPAGVLQPPYFHPQYPASINYGGLGVVAGHELSHGFDDQGVQWDGVGKLGSWMSDYSKQGFQRLANCVINEYNGFCPLPTSYSPNCVKGEQTQGENIADNGGIHAAWRAYKTFIALNGPDPRLPDPLLGQFTHDQLFFLAFARVWCREQSPGWFFSELLTDAHSPPMYRVIGIMQNFPAFQTAFNCPTGSKHAPGPGKHCNVWVLDNN